MDATLQSTGAETPDSSAMCQDLKPIHSMSLSMAGNEILQKAPLGKPPSQNSTYEHRNTEKTQPEMGSYLVPPSATHFWGLPVLIFVSGFIKQFFPSILTLSCKTRF